MIQVVAPIALVAAMGGITHTLLRSGWMAVRSRRASTTRRRLPDGEVRACVAEFGRSANSFMTLYPGFEYFAHPDAAVRGLIAFVETQDAWVGGAEPFCAPADRPKLLEAFAAGARALGKSALLLPVDEKNAELARASGYQAVMIGTEPTWDLERFPRTGRTWTDVVPTAKSLAAKGAKVSPFDPATLTAEARAELEQMTQDWLGTRKMDTLAFLNQVDPWFRQADKRYFKIESQGRVLAFLAAIPVWAGNGWYLIDLIRRADSPAGATELLLLQAMRELRAAGAAYCTMGVAPLSGIEKAEEFAVSRFAERRRTYRILHWIYENGNALYNFKPLHQYKLKFDPTSSPPVYLIYHPTLGVRDLLALSRAFQPAGMVRATWSGALRMATRFSLAEWIRAQLTTRTVVRSVPPSWSRLLQRCKLTAALLVANLLIYFATTDSAGLIQPGIENAWGFSWETFGTHPVRALVLSPFLHWNLTHLCVNLLTLAAFTGGLVYLAGSGITAVCYFVPMLLSNPLTGELLALLKPWVFSINLGEIDVGASLGIFGTAGALSLFLRWGPWMLGCMAVGAVLSAAVTHTFMPFNHLAAIALGWLCGRLILRN